MISHDLNESPPSHKLKIINHSDPISGLFSDFLLSLTCLALAYMVYFLHINVYDHIILNTPVLVWSLKFSKVELCWYLDGWPPGNIFLPLIQFQTRGQTVPNKWAYDIIPFLTMSYCIRIRTRGGIYGKIWPEPEGNPEGSGLFFTIYPDFSPNTDIIPFLTMIYWVF